MRIAAAASASVLALAAWGQAEGEKTGPRETERPAVAGKSALLRGLDTITGTAGDFTAPVGGTAKFGRLTVKVSACRFLPENPSTNSYAYVTVTEGPDAPPVFSAWMIASAPALSAMEHPRYDIWLIRCSAETETPSNG